MINDYIFVTPASVIDLSVNVKVVISSNQNSGAIASNIINQVSAFFDPRNRNLGQNVNVSELRSNIQIENGVVSVTDIEFFNNVGGQYSSSQTSQQYENSETRKIKLINDTIFAETTQVYQVRFPNKDITIQYINQTTTNFS
jgi:hypothetical protein